jgi:hypothetical protein
MHQHPASSVPMSRLSDGSRTAAAGQVDSPASVAPPPEGWSVEMYGYLKDHIGAFGPHEIRTLVSALEQA